MKLRFAVKTHHWIHILNSTLCTLFWFCLFLSFHFLLWLWADVFFLHLSLPDPWRPEAGHSCCLRLPQPITVPAETRAAQRPVIFHSSVLEPNTLSPLTHSYSSCMTLADRSYLGFFLPSLQLAYLIYLCSSRMPFSKSCCLALFWTVSSFISCSGFRKLYGISVMLQTGEEVILWSICDTILVFDVMIQCEAWQIVQFCLRVMSEWPYLWYVLTNSGNFLRVMLVLITKYIRLITLNVWYSFTIPLYKTSHTSGLHILCTANALFSLIH